MQLSRGLTASARASEDQSMKKVLSIPLLLFISVLSLLQVQAASKPSVKVNHFDSLPARISYFDDSAALLYHDSEHGNVYRSEDEGANWNLVSGPEKGKSYMVMEHPYDGKTVSQEKERGEEQEGRGSR